VVWHAYRVVPRLLMQVLVCRLQELSLLHVADARRADLAEGELGGWESHRVGCRHEDSVDHVVTGRESAGHVLVAEISIRNPHAEAIDNGASGSDGIGPAWEGESMAGGDNGGARHGDPHVGSSAVSDHPLGKVLGQCVSVREAVVLEDVGLLSLEDLRLHGGDFGDQCAPVFAACERKDFFGDYAVVGEVRVGVRGGNVMQGEQVLAFVRQLLNSPRSVEVDLQGFVDGVVEVDRGRRVEDDVHLVDEGLADLRREAESFNDQVTVDGNHALFDDL
jgi:hypothetical protein